MAQLAARMFAGITRLMIWDSFHRPQDAVPPKELCSIEGLESDAATGKLASRLPMLANPIPGEALTAWLHRFASKLKLPPATLLIDAEEGDLPRDDTWWRNPP